jgi:hypothetical protein
MRFTVGVFGVSRLYFFLFNPTRVLSKNLIRMTSNGFRQVV